MLRECLSQAITALCDLPATSVCCGSARLRWGSVKLTGQLLKVLIVWFLNVKKFYVFYIELICAPPWSPRLGKKGGIQIDRNK